MALLSVDKSFYPLVMRLVSSSDLFCFSWGYVCDQTQLPGTLLTLGEVACHNINASYSLQAIRRYYSKPTNGMSQ